ncbi:cytochrome c biogenesis protein CcdA [Candidatus Woesearchaeota archaeon]|nr:cytochrome c biogenesis protein CcdA [Candidatus Woesearchaeota archaeon]
MTSLIVFLLAAFISGVLTFLAPCTLPILPAYFAYATNAQQRNITRDTIYFGLGLAIIFTLLGITAGSLGKVVLGYKREIVYVFSALFIIFGVIIGLGYKLPLLSNNPAKKRYASFGFGSLIGLTWSGCIGPVLGFMLVLAAQTETIVGGGLLLFVYSLGLLFPLFLLSLYFDRLSPESKFWKLLQGRLIKLTLLGKEYTFHTTTLATGILFILLGIFLLINVTVGIINLFPQIFTNWIFSLEDKLVTLFNLSI